LRLGVNLACIAGSSPGPWTEMVAHAASICARVGEKVASTATQSPTRVTSTGSCPGYDQSPNLNGQVQDETHFVVLRERSPADRPAPGPEPLPSQPPSLLQPQPHRPVLQPQQHPQRRCHPPPDPLHGSSDPALGHERPVVQAAAGVLVL